jgi:hypothetical protein
MDDTTTDAASATYGKFRRFRPKPDTLTGDLRRLPAALTPLVDLPCWVLWRWEMSETGKWTKVPYQPNGRKAKNNDPTTWSSYDTVISVVERFDGIGFCLLSENIAAFDIDCCRDPDSGTIHPWAQSLVEKVGSYTEITVSGTGLRIIGYGDGPKVHRKQSVAEGVTLEAYRQAERYIVITGNPLPGADFAIANIDAQIDATVAELDSKKGNGKAREGDGAESNDERQQGQQGAGDDELEDLIRNGCGDRFGGDRSKAVWHVVHELLRRGHLPSSIERILLDRGKGISQHIYDQGKPQEYAHRQVAKAVQEIDFSRNEHSAPFPSQSNIRIALLKLGVTVRYDQFADRVLIEGLKDFGPALDDRAVARIWLLLEQRFHLRPSQGLLFTVVTDTAILNGFHPVRDYLDSLRWDGEKRIDRWLTTYAGAADDEFTRAAGALFLIAAVRRVRAPGCKFDEMLVLENPTQGTDKSSALAVLAVKAEWFTDDLPLHMEGKRVIEALRGKWIVEAAELEGLKRADIAHLKAFLSRQTDRGRMAYDRLVTEVPRQCVLAGTTNSMEYLRDMTGNRRVWPVLVRRFKVDKLRQDRDQLWAEAAAREAAGASIRLAPKLWALAGQAQDQRLTLDPWFDKLGEELGEFKQAKISMESLWVILDVKTAQRGQDGSRRIGDAMRLLGWHKNTAGTIKIDGKHVPGFLIGEPPRRTIVASRDTYGVLSVDERAEAERARPTLDE